MEPASMFRSRNANTWSTHSRRIDPINLSAKPFCQGERCGRPPSDWDFHRQYHRKPARCQRIRVSGRMIVMVSVGEVNTTTHLPPQYDQLTSEGHVLCLKSALRPEQRDHRGADVRRFSYLINTDEVFGTHRAKITWVGPRRNQAAASPLILPIPRAAESGGC
jgi:hypothetical protein